MATQSTSVTSTVKDLTTEFSLVEGTQYVLQYQGQDYLRINAGANAPTGDSASHFRVGDGDTATILAKAGEVVYAWTASRLGGEVIVDSVS